MIRKTYLALSRTGRVVQSFSEEALARSFADRMRAQSVPIELVVETTFRKNCGDEPYSASVHDFRSCKCGAISVDGGQSYLRRVATSIDLIEEMSIEIPKPASDAAIEAIKWAQSTGRNELGILCAVARALRDNGVRMEASPLMKGE